MFDGEVDLDFVRYRAFWEETLRACGGYFQQVRVSIFLVVGEAFNEVLEGFVRCGSLCVCDCSVSVDEETFCLVG